MALPYNHTTTSTQQKATVDRNLGLVTLEPAAWNVYNDKSGNRATSDIPDTVKNVRLTHTEKEDGTVYTITGGVRGHDYGKGGDYYSLITNKDYLEKVLKHTEGKSDDQLSNNLRILRKAALDSDIRGTKVYSEKQSFTLRGHLGTLNIWHEEKTHDVKESDVADQETKYYYQHTISGPGAPPRGAAAITEKELAEYASRSDWISAEVLARIRGSDSVEDSVREWKPMKIPGFVHWKPSSSNDTSENQGQKSEESKYDLTFPDDKTFTITKKKLIEYTGLDETVIETSDGIKWAEYEWKEVQQDIQEKSQQTGRVESSENPSSNVEEAMP